MIFLRQYASTGLVCLSLLVANEGTVLAQTKKKTPTPPASSTVNVNLTMPQRDPALQDTSFAGQAQRDQAFQKIAQATNKALKEEEAPKAVITDYLTRMKQALAKNQFDTYKTLVDELNNLIISDLEKEFSTLAKAILAENNVYKLMVLQDHISQGTISDKDYERTVNALYADIYQPCKGNECEVRGAMILTLATAGSFNVAKKHGHDIAFTNKIVRRISGAAKNNYGGFESDKIIGEHLIPALSILSSPTGMRTVVQTYVNKYGKKGRYEPASNPQDAFLIQLTELAVQFPVLLKRTAPNSYHTPNLLADWANSDNFLLQLRGNIEIGRSQFRLGKKYYSDETLAQVRQYLRTKYCNIGNAYGTNIKGTAEDKFLARRDISFGYNNGNKSEVLTSAGASRCHVTTPAEPNQQEIIDDLAHTALKTVILFAIPPGCALAGIAKVAKSAIKAVKLANKTGKPLRDIYKTAKAVHKGQKGYDRAHALENAARNIQNGPSALGRQGAYDAKVAAEARQTQKAYAGQRGVAGSPKTATPTIPTATKKVAPTAEGTIVKDGNSWISRSKTAPTTPPPGVEANSGTWQRQIGYGEQPYIWRGNATNANPRADKLTDLPSTISQDNTPAWGGSYYRTPTDMTGTASAVHHTPQPMVRGGNGGTTTTTRNPIGYRIRASEPSEYIVTDKLRDLKFVVRESEGPAIQKILTTAADNVRAKTKVVHDLNMEIAQLEKKEQQLFSFFGRDSRQAKLAQKQQELRRAKTEYDRAVHQRREVLTAIRNDKTPQEIQNVYETAAKSFDPAAATARPAAQANNGGLEVVEMSPEEARRFAGQESVTPPTTKGSTTRPVPQADNAGVEVVEITPEEARRLAGKESVTPPTPKAPVRATTIPTNGLSTRMSGQIERDDFKELINEISTNLDKAKSNTALSAAQRARVEEAEQYFARLTPAQANDIRTLTSAEFRQHAAVLRSPTATEHAFYVEGAGFEHAYDVSASWFVGQENGFIPSVVGNPQEGFSRIKLQQTFSTAEKTNKPILVQITSHGEIDGAGRFYIPSRGLNSSTQITTTELVDDLQMLRKTTGTPVVNLQLDACHSGQFMREFEALPKAKREGINVFAHSGGVQQEGLLGSGFAQTKSRGVGSIASHQQQVLIDQIKDGNVFSRGYIDGVSFNPLEQAALRAKAEGSPLATELQLLSRLQNASKREVEAIMKQYTKINPSVGFSRGSNFNRASVNVSKQILNYITDTSNKMISGQRWGKQAASSTGGFFGKFFHKEPEIVGVI